MTVAHASHDPHAKTVFGFWVYLMTDCILFATLFATYVVLHKNSAGGPTTHQIYDLPYALTETFILLISSFTCGMAMLAIPSQNKKLFLAGYVLTFLLGAAFVGMELNEFSHLVHQGNSWERSAFLSSFFTLVGTHGLHVSVGLLWMLVLVPQVLYRGFSASMVRRLTCLRLFWHFLDLVWIFIFTIVYLMGVA